MALSTGRIQRRKGWNKTVQGQIKALESVKRWAQSLEAWGEKNKDWYSERGAGRVKSLLELAEVELYDLQYFISDDERKKWRTAQDFYQ